MFALIGYIISGLIVETWLIYEQVIKKREYSFTIVDIIIGITIIEFWPIILILKSLNIKFDKELFKITLNN